MLAPLFVVPLISLLALWGFAASVTLLNALREHNFTSENNLYGEQAQALGLQLATERLQVYVWLSSQHETPFASLIEQRQATDKAVAAFRRGASARPGTLSLAAQRALTSFNSMLGQLTAITSSSEQTEFVMKAGWATFPGQADPNRDVAEACATALLKTAVAK